MILNKIIKVAKQSLKKRKTYIKRCSVQDCYIVGHDSNSFNVCVTLRSLDTVYDIWVKVNIKTGEITEIKKEYKI